MVTVVSRVLSVALVLFSTSSSGSAFAPSSRARATSNLNVASAESRTDISDLGRGMGGRIEEAFAAAKEKGEAAFVTFVTAGYPKAEGECCAAGAFPVLRTQLTRYSRLDWFGMICSSLIDNDCRHT